MPTRRRRWSTEADGEGIDEGVFVFDDQHRLDGHDATSIVWAPRARLVHAGKRSVNVEPMPSRDVTDTEPPWLSAT